MFRIIKFCLILFLMFPISHGYKYIIVPGLGGTRLYNSMGQTIWPPTSLNWRDKSIEIPYDHHHNVIWREGMNHEIGNLERIKIDSHTTFLLTKNVYYTNMIKALQNDGHEVYAFPYDFRYIHSPEYLSSLYKEFQNFLIQKHHTPYIFICHSLGGIVLHHFISTYLDHDVAQLCIEKIYYLNVPFGGCPTSTFSIVHSLKSSDDGLQSLEWIRIRNLFLYGGFYLSMPHGKEPLIRKEGKWYTPQNIDSLFSNYPIANKNYKLFLKDFVPWKNHSFPISQVVIYSSHKNTSVFLDMDSKTHLYQEGDGLVPIQSLTYPRFWKHTPIWIPIKNMEHSKINSYEPVLKMISKNKNHINLKGDVI